VIRRLHSGAEKCIFTDALDKIEWLPRDDAKSVFIPIGANIPEAASGRERHAAQDGAARTVAVFGVTEYPIREREREIADISHAVRAATMNGVGMKVLFMGRGTGEAAEAIKSAFREIRAEVAILGLMSAGEVSKQLAESDAMLFVRGRVQARRGSVMAGVACGLPIVGYAGAAEGTPLGEAGVELVRYGDRDALGAAVTHVLTDANLRRALREKSVCAQRKYFSWDAIAATFVRCLEAGVSSASAGN